MKTDQPIGRPLGIGPAARPRIARGILHEARPNRVPIQVPEGRQSVGVLLDETGTIAPLLTVAPTASRPMEGPGALGH